MLTEREFTDAAERYLDMVYRIALNYFRHPADAEDAAQDVMLRLWQTDRTFEGDDYLRYFLVRVTLNVCRDISRSPWHRRTVPLESCREPSFSTPERQKLFRAAQALPLPGPAWVISMWAWRGTGRRPCWSGSPLILQARVPCWTVSVRPRCW